ncbi:MAG TPA: hypothetical protein VGJ56_05515 [Reyranella sp.]
MPDRGVGRHGIAARVERHGPRLAAKGLQGKVVAQAKPIAASCEEQSCRIVLLLNKGQELLLADASKAAIMSGTERCGP